MSYVPLSGQAVGATFLGAAIAASVAVSPADAAKERNLFYVVEQGMDRGERIKVPADFFSQVRALKETPSRKRPHDFVAQALQNASIEDQILVSDVYDILEGINGQPADTTSVMKPPGSGDIDPKTINDPVAVSVGILAHLGYCIHTEEEQAEKPEIMRGDFESDPRYRRMYRHSSVIESLAASMPTNAFEDYVVTHPGEAESVLTTLYSIFGGKARVEFDAGRSSAYVSKAHVTDLFDKQVSDTDPLLREIFEYDVVEGNSTKTILGWSESKQGQWHPHRKDSGEYSDGVSRFDVSLAGLDRESGAHSSHNVSVFVKELDADQKPAWDAFKAKVYGWWLQQQPSASESKAKSRAIRGSVLMADQGDIVKEPAEYDKLHVTDFNSAPDVKIYRRTDTGAFSDNYDGIEPGAVLLADVFDVETPVADLETRITLVDRETNNVVARSEGLFLEVPDSLIAGREYRVSATTTDKGHGKAEPKHAVDSISFIYRKPEDKNRPKTVLVAQDKAPDVRVICMADYSKFLKDPSTLSAAAPELLSAYGVSLGDNVQVPLYNPLQENPAYSGYFFEVPADFQGTGATIDLIVVAADNSGDKDLADILIRPVPNLDGSALPVDLQNQEPVRVHDDISARIIRHLQLPEDMQYSVWRVSDVHLPLGQEVVIDRKKWSLPVLGPFARKTKTSVHSIGAPYEIKVTVTDQEGNQGEANNYVVVEPHDVVTRYKDVGVHLLALAGLIEEFSEKSGPAPTPAPTPGPTPSGITGGETGGNQITGFGNAKTGLTGGEGSGNAFGGSR